MNVVNLQFDIAVKLTFLCACTDFIILASCANVTQCFQQKIFPH